MANHTHTHTRKPTSTSNENIRTNKNELLKVSMDVLVYYISKKQKKSNYQYIFVCWVLCLYF